VERDDGRPDRRRAPARRARRGALTVIMTATYIRVLVLEAVVITALWLFGRFFA
jgi:hypothetical protein